jgi:hypothetical protein
LFNALLSPAFIIMTIIWIISLIVVIKAPAAWPITAIATASWVVTLSFIGILPLYVGVSVIIIAVAVTAYMISKVAGTSQ